MELMKTSFKNSTRCEDRISKLPREIIDSILVRMPIRDAVRTSILSREWRYKWNTMPVLVFDVDFFARHVPDGFQGEDFFSRHSIAVDRVVFRHHGPIRRFELDVFFLSPHDVRRWITFISSFGVKELKLYNGDVDDDEQYELPSSIFSCDLTSLDLCRVDLPDSFRGFRNLKTLRLDCVSIGKEKLEFLISNSPYLDNLKLMNLYDITSRSIRAPNLVKLKIVNEEFDMEDAPNLTKASISINDDFNDSYESEDGAECKLIKFLSSIPGIRELKLKDSALQMLTTGKIPTSFLKTCQLKDLSISINFEDSHDIRAALCIIRSSPLLVRLNVKEVAQLSSHGDILEHLLKGLCIGLFAQEACQNG